MTYDAIFVGGGIANLYMAYRCKKAMPNIKLLILEKEASVGGRMQTAEFCGQEVPLGAGVGRLSKDRLLKRLLKDLGLDLDIGNKSWKPDIQKSERFESSLDVSKTVAFLKSELEKLGDNREIHVTFAQFAKPLLGLARYASFVESVGYSDFESADVYDTIYNYGFDDTYSGHKVFPVPWRRLWEALIEAVGKSNVKCKTIVETIHSDGVVHTNRGTFEARCVVVGTDVASLRQLFPGHGIYRQICGQPFTRVYAKIAPGPFLNTYTIVPNILQKIIPMDVGNGIHMIGYADNNRADKLAAVAKNKNKLEALVVDGTGFPVRISKLMSKYWPIGTHYYRPLPRWFETRSDFIRKAQRPEQRVFVVGEAVSIHQGWVEGALESVEWIWPEFQPKFLARV